MKNEKIDYALNQGLEINKNLFFKNRIVRIAIIEQLGDIKYNPSIEYMNKIIKNK